MRTCNALNGRRLHLSHTPADFGHVAWFATGPTHFTGILSLATFSFFATTLAFSFFSIGFVAFALALGLVILAF